MICGFLGCASAERNPVILTLLKLDVARWRPLSGFAQHSNMQRMKFQLVA
jgi:hypothetical protein